jgi:hypothetical protein
MRRVFFIIPLLLMASFSLAATPCTAETPQEFKVKAGYLLNIPMFADWPPSAASCSSFTIGVLGETPLHDALETMKGKRIKNRPVVILAVHDIPQTDCCQVLFIAASERFRLQRLLPEAHRRGIMTISDMRDFVKLGGMVALVTINNRITFDLNLAAARSAAISFSSQLLKLANDVSN